MTISLFSESFVSGIVSSSKRTLSFQRHDNDETLKPGAKSKTWIFPFVTGMKTEHRFAHQNKHVSTSF